MEDKIKEFLAARGPAELSALWHEIPNDDPSSVVMCAFAVAQRGEVWWLDVSEDHAIVGLPDQAKPENPLAYLGLTVMESSGDAFLVPTELVRKRSATSD